MSNKKGLLIISILLIFLTVGYVSASDNITDDSSYQTQDIGDIENNECGSSQIDEESQNQMNTKIEAKDVITYYKEKSELVSYLKDNNNQPISNKSLSITINNNNYNKITDNAGKVTLKLNLKPGTYNTLIRFDGDDNYISSSKNMVVKVKTAVLNIQTKNYKTYFESNLFFKAKVTNKVTKNPVEGIKVAFKVYQNKKYKTYYATTDANGIAELKKNFKVGSYKVVTTISNKNTKAKKSKASLTVMETAECGCSSLYVQVSNTEAVAGFRRDATNAKTLHIVKYTLNGKSAIKQYKKNSYFFHLVTTSDGWMFGTGGWDNPTVNHAIEKIAGKISKKGKITKADLKKIQRWERKLPLGHFSIKAPSGKYGLVWSGSIYMGKLKPGEYIKVPNAKSLFRYGTWKKFSKDPAKAAIKIAASDSFGVNRRDATAFHWKATTKEGKTTSTLKVYAANDNGRLAGRSTGHLKDDIYFKGKFFSKNNLPKTPSKMLLGVHNFGNIDKLIKTQTKVKVSKLTKFQSESKTLNINVKDKKTKKPIKNLKLKIKIGKKTFTVKTNSKGIAKFDSKSLKVGTYSVKIYSGNIKYFVSAKTTIKINNGPSEPVKNETIVKPVNDTKTNNTVNGTNVDLNNSASDSDVGKNNSGNDLLNAIREVMNVDEKFRVCDATCL